MTVDNIEQQWEARNTATGSPDPYGNATAQDTAHSILGIRYSMQQEIDSLSEELVSVY